MITIKKINSAANKLEIKLGFKKTGRPSPDLVKQIEKRNLLMLAVYEYSKSKTGKGNNYRGEIRYVELCELFNISSQRVSEGLKTAREIRSRDYDRFENIRRMIA